MGKTILLADDSITIQKVIELTFSDEDYQVVTVGNGRLAVERVQEVRPDVVLCDIIMPEKDGYEVCDFIKKTPGLSHIPVLLLTGAFEPFDQERAQRVRCDGYLAKPFEPQALIARVKDLLAQPAAAAAPAPAAAPPAPPVAAAAAPPAEAPEEAAFIPDETFEVVSEPEKAAPPPAAEQAPVEEFGVVEEPFEAAPQAAAEPEPAAPVQGESTAAFAALAESTWSQPTVEVSLEARARASREVPTPEAAPVFDEVFEEAAAPAAGTAELVEPEPAAAPEADAIEALAEPEAAAPGREEAFEEAAFAAEAAPAEPEEIEAPLPPPAHVAPASTIAATPRVSTTPAPRVVAEAPAPSPASFAEFAPAEQAPSVPSVAAEQAVPVEMVETIAQRVVAQISEKVVREIAWEVIPDLAEALIKQEIERLKAELKSL